MTIDEFVHGKRSGECDILQRLYDFLRVPYAKGGNFISGLTLLDIESYGGTILYDSKMTPTNTLAFATTCGDDVHFGMLSREGLFGDLSPIVMTVPMASDNPLECNFVLGETLHEFLCLGCVHGFSDLEKLAYTWKSDLFTQYAIPPKPTDDKSYERFRAAFSLTPWPEIEERQKSLDAVFKATLQFSTRKRKWWKFW